MRDDLRIGYQQILDGVARAGSAARGASGVFTLGLHGTHAHEYADIINLFRARYPNVDLRFREMHFSDPFGPVRAGEVDVATTWLPVREPDLTVGPQLRSEPVVLAVSAGHPLAGRSSVTMEDLGDWIVPQTEPWVPEYWVALLTPPHTPGGRPIRRGPKVTTFQETLAVVASGDAICPVHGESVRYYQRPGVVFVPIQDAPIGTWVLVWCAERESALVRGFAQAARDQTATTGQTAVASKR